MRYHVLAIDDDPGILSAIARCLRPFDVELSTASSANAALSYLTLGRRFDGILLDMRLGERMCGRGLYQEIRRIDPRQAERVMIMSGARLTADDWVFIEGLGDRFLAKPMTIEGVIAAVVVLVGIDVLPRRFAA